MALNPVPPPDISPAEIDKRQLYGSAVLYQGGTTEIDTAFGPEGVFGVVLGYNADDPTYGLGWAPGEGEGHALTFGATRSGKGVAAIIPALTTYAGSAVVVDPKGENAWTTAPRRRQLGQRVVILDHWGEVNRRYAEGGEGETVTRFNPLSTLDPKSPDFADEVAAIADALIIDTTSDPHWSNSARELIGGLIAAFVEARPGSATCRRSQSSGLVLANSADFCSD